MPDVPVIDTHLHLWDVSRLSYPWLRTLPRINKPFLPFDYRLATGPVPVEAMVFLQCECLPDEAESEAAWVASLAADDDPRIRGMVAWAPLERGREAGASLERLKRHGILRGVRRIIQFEPDPDFCLKPDFVAGVRMLKEFDLSFDICIDHRHFANVIRMVDRCPDTRFVLDHIGKPAIRDGQFDGWAEDMRRLAAFPHVWCKLSGVATEADHANWTRDQLRPFIRHAVECFGAERCMFGGDWPVALLATSWTEWVEVLDWAIADLSATDRRRIWRDNAIGFYRL